MQLYKYIKKKYKEGFQFQGILRLSLLKKFHTTDDLRQDPNEGVDRYRNNPAALTVLDKQKLMDILPDNIITNGPITSFPGSDLDIGNHLPPLLSFSTSTILDNTLMKKFDTDSYFIIVDPQKFGLEILKSIPSRLKVGAYCFDFINYVEEKNTRIAEPKKDNFRLIQKSGYLYNLTNLRKMFGNYFCKPKASTDKAITYDDEKEFRFGYLIEEKPENDYIDIICPNALKYVIFDN